MAFIIEAKKDLPIDMGENFPYLGFSEKVSPNFEFFLSCGIQGKFEGERYKKSPEIVKELYQNLPPSVLHPVP